MNGFIKVKAVSKDFKESMFRINVFNDVSYYREWSNEQSGENNQTVFYMKSGKQIVVNHSVEEIDIMIGL